ncbi:MAG: YdcF family protein [Coleofasciculus sp. S288]|nr:YdcF family protein [Coleofasciculus sp. S288]
MFLLLTQILLWVIITVVLYQLLLKVIPKAYLTVLGGLFLFALIVLAFFFPNDRLVSAAWRLLSFPLKPVGASIILLSFALRQGLEKSRNLISAALLILLVSSTPFLSNLLAQTTELGAVQAQPVQPAGAIVVLGRGTTQASLPPRPQVQLTDTGDRILYAAQLYRQQVSLGSRPLVIVSAGPREELQGTRNEANDIATLLVQMGVPREQIVIDPQGVDLRSSAVRTRRTLVGRGLGNTRVIVVTSGINSRRAQLAFSDVGLNVVARPTDFVGIQRGATPRLRLRVESFIPSVESLVVTTRVWEEFLASIYYSLRGWLSPAML